MTDRPTWQRRLAAFHRDERGAEGLEKVLIIAAVALPLLGLLIAYRKEINRWINETWSTTKSEGDAPFEQPQ